MPTASPDSLLATTGSQEKGGGVWWTRILLTMCSSSHLDYVVIE